MGALKELTQYRQNVVPCFDILFVATEALKMFDGLRFHFPLNQFVCWGEMSGSSSDKEASESTRLRLYRTMRPETKGAVRRSPVCDI